MSLMKDKEITTYGYKWVVLAGFMLVAATNQGLWITFAPITSDAMKFYAASDIMIGLLSIVFMAVYIVLVLPAAWLIDTWGLRGAVSLGAALTAVFGVMRGLFADNFALVFVAQVGIAVGQPLILGSITKLAGRWFPRDERATAAGLGTLAIYLGILASLIVTPPLLNAHGMKTMLLWTGIVSAAAAAFFIATVREKPPTPAGPADQEVRSLMFDGLKSMMKQKDFILLLIIFFVGLGMFNGVTTWIEEIIAPRGFSGAQAGTAGGLMLIGGIVGAVVIPLVSDSSQAVRSPGARGTPPRPRGSRIRPFLRSSARLRVRVRPLPAERGSHRVPVRGGDHPARAGGDLEQHARGHGAGVGNPVHIRNGRIQGSGRIHDRIPGHPVRSHGSELRAGVIPSGVADPSRMRAGPACRGSWRG